MPSSLPSLKQLRQMIGMRVRSPEGLWRVIEVVEEGPLLILQSADGQSVLQADQYGETARRTPATRAIPVANTAGTGLHPRFLELELVSEAPP